MCKTTLSRVADQAGVQIGVRDTRPHYFYDTHYPIFLPLNGLSDTAPTPGPRRSRRSLSRTNARLNSLCFSRAAVSVLIPGSGVTSPASGMPPTPSCVADRPLTVASELVVRKIGCRERSMTTSVG
eukprot:1182701-Prorocentrum_minimum.AAC.2